MYFTFTMIFFRVGYRLTPVTRYGIAYKSNSYCCSGYVSGPGSSCIRKFLDIIKLLIVAKIIITTFKWDSIYIYNLL